MKMRLFFILFLALPLMAPAQSFDQMWKSVNEAQGKDLPKTEIKQLDKIVAKASKEGNYGQLLAATFRRASTQLTISPDSLENEVNCLEANARTAKDPALQSVYYAVLSKIYANNRGLGDNRMTKSNDYRAKAMSHPEVLARVKAKDYEPFVGKGIDSRIFNDDLLHVVGMFIGDYTTMSEYYDRQDNDDAACLSALWKAEASSNYDVSISTLDSLLNRYKNADARAEVAICKYDAMPNDDNIEKQKKYDYGEKLISTFSNWKNINKVRNNQKRLTVPSLSMTNNTTPVIPGEKIKADLTSTNIPTVRITLTKLNANGNEDLNLYSEKEINRVKAKRIKSTEKVITKQIPFAHPYDVTVDSIVIPTLPVGVWLAELSAPGTSNIKPDYFIINVSNVSVITEMLPDKKVRIVAVNATTGKPLPKTSLRLEQANYYGKAPTVYNVTTNSKGEYTWTANSNRGASVWAYTADDKAAPIKALWGSFGHNGKAKTDNKLHAFTDRSIYRPGQTVHVNVIAYTQDNVDHNRKALTGSDVKFILRDANYKDVSTISATTDKYGSASASFVLPSAGLTGRYSISCSTDNAADNVSFNVEEYKRPTFEVTFDDYKEAYSAGDTITVRGHAKTYSGVAVAKAKVEYTVNRRGAWWWRSWGDNSDEFKYSSTTTTDDNGDFSVRVPVILPKSDMKAIKEGKRLYHYYNMVVDAKVTDNGGESHEGTMNLPVGTNPTTLACNIPDKILKGSALSIMFTRTNAAGKEIDGSVRWTVSTSDNPKEAVSHSTSSANKAIAISTSASWMKRSGAYLLTAICGNDTVKKDFIVFSVNDKHPVVKTHDWFWQSAEKFPSDGKPVYVQFGSSDDDQYVFYTILTSDDKIIDQGQIRQSNAITTKKFIYRSEYGDALAIDLAWVRNGELYDHKAVITMPEKDNKLRLSWKTFRNKLIPGQKEEWTLTVKEPDGKSADAQLMATLYDKSLDQIIKHQWLFNPTYDYTIPFANWTGIEGITSRANISSQIKYLDNRPLIFRTINDSYINGFLYYHMFTRSYRGGRVMLMANSNMAATEDKAMPLGTMAMAKKRVQAPMEYQEVTVADSVVSDGEASEGEDKTSVRKNLNETAFFYPQLTTNHDGTVSLKFTLPESVTTWRFMGLAHDSAINYGMITDEVVAKKDVMVQPNMPRFIRQGDKAVITTRIFNTTDKAVKGNVRMEILDPTSEKVLSTEKAPFTIDASGSTSASFNVNSSAISHKGNSESLFIVRFTAEGNGFSDGEQHYLAVLPDAEYVTNTYPFTVIGDETKSIDINKVVPKDAKNAKVTFEYTTNPSWLMIQALPFVGKVNEKNAISLVTAYFANTIASKIIDDNPSTRATFEQWRREKGQETSLMSNLEKDEDLKALVLSETPWVADAETESEQKRLLSTYFDENALNSSLFTLRSSLKNLQNPDGSFSWWPGMDGSFYMTMAVVKTLVRLQTMTGEKGIDVSRMISRAWPYLDRQAAKRIAELKRLEAKKVKVYPSDVLCDYIYTNALAKSSSSANIDYVVKLIEKMPRDLTIYGKANCAVIMAMYGKTKTANEYLQSIDEYSVYKEEMGRYFDTPKAYYSWFDYKIPTQTAAIEAYRMLRPNDMKTITDMQRWILQSKRTQVWDTPLNSVNAIYAFLSGNEASSQQSLLSLQGDAKVSIDNRNITLPTPTAGIGYMKTDISNDVKSGKTMAVRTDWSTDADDRADRLSWSAVYSQFFQKTTNIKSMESGLKVTREVLTTDGKAANNLKVGDKIKVRITIIADRDYDFVQVIDRRAASLEPISQLSGYRWGYYLAPHDFSTNYYFDRMAKGKHVVETEYYIDRAGEYQSGTVIAQCTYAPEFMGREGGSLLTSIK